MNDQQKTKKQLLEDLQRERERSIALQEVSNKVVAAHDTDEVLDLIVNEAVRLIGASAATLRLLEGNRLVPRAATDSATAHLAVAAEIKEAYIAEDSSSIMGRVLATKKPYLTEDAQNDPLLTSEAARQNLQRSGFHAGVNIPLLVNDQAIGVLVVFDKRIRQWAEDEVSLLSAFADQASLALEKARLLNNAEREKERSEALYQISNKLAGAHDTDEVLDLIVNEAARLVGTDASFLRLLEGGRLVPSAATKGAAAFLASGARELPVIPVEEGTSLVGHVMATKKPLTILDGQIDETVTPAGRLSYLQHGLHGTATVPLLANDQSIGVLVVMDSQVRRFTDDEISLLAAFADQAALALEKARLLNEAEREKERSDALYQVSNRLAGVHDTDEVLDLIVNEAARLLSVPIAYIRLAARKDLVASAATAAAVGLLADLDSSTVIEKGGNPAGHVMATREAFVVEEISQAEFLTPEQRSIMEKHGLRGGAIVPLVANDQSLGVLVLADTRPRRLTDDEVSLLTAFSDQAALALDKARLLNEAEARERQAAQLYEVTAQLASNHDLESVLDLITQQAVELMDGNSGMLFQFGESRGGLVAVNNFKMRPEILDSLVLPGEGIAGRAYLERRVEWTSDYSMTIEDPSFTSGDRSTARSQISDLGAMSIVGAPIMIEDSVWGVLDVVFDKTKEFTDEEISLIQNLANSAAVAINNARFIEETKQARDEATQLYEITEQLASSPDMDSVLDLITAKAVELIGSEASALWKFDESRGGLVVVRGHNIPSGEWADRLVAPGDATTGRAFEERRPIWSRDILSDPSWTIADPVSDAINRATSMGGALAVPIIIRDEVYGALNTFFYEPHDFTDGEIQLLEALADSAAVAINNARFIEETEQARDLAEAREREAVQLQEVTTQLASNTDMDDVLGLIARKASELIGSQATAIWKLDQASGVLTVARGHNVPPNWTDVVIIKPGEGTPGRAFEELRPVWTSEFRSNYSDRTTQEISVAAEIGGSLSVPIIIRNLPYGVLCTFYYEPHDFTESEIQLLQTLADSAAVAIGKSEFIEETRLARDDAEEANRTKSEFLANMSHELRTPLNAIIGYSELLQEEAADLENEEFEEDLERINGAGKHLLGLINDVLDISKIKAGAMDIYLETFPITPMIHDVVTTMQPLVQKNSNLLAVDCPDSVGSIHADTTKVRQGLFNLLSNASKFTEQGTISLTISRETTDGQDWINLRCGRHRNRHDRRTDGETIRGVHPGGSLNQPPPWWHGVGLGNHPPFLRDDGRHSTGGK